MDTRTKIITLGEAARRARAANLPIVLAQFDILTAGRIRRLREIAGSAESVVAIVAENGAGDADSLLPSKARAELAASLAIIDAVVIANITYEEARKTFGDAAVFDERESDARLTAGLVDFIQQKCRPVAP